MDVYSFGMLCLWVICNDTFSKPNLKGIGFMDSEKEHPKPINFNTLEYGKEELPALASQVITMMPGMDEEQKSRLKRFFSMSLAYKPEIRCSAFEELILLLGGNGYVHNKANKSRF